MTIHIGTSGWSYDHWHGVLYPHSSPSHERLRYYLEHFHTVEVNSTFYRWPPDTAFAHWQRRLPESFHMSVKAPRGLTHGVRLYSPERWWQRMSEGLRCLGGKRGVLLVQLPPQFECDPARLTYFLEQAPSWLKIAVELRHLSWHTEPIFELLERTGTAYCVMSGANLPCVLRATASFVYVRLHGPDHQHLYAGSYSEADLHWWAERMREWQQSGRDVFAYFNNDGEGNAVRNAERLKAILGV